MREFWIIFEKKKRKKEIEEVLVRNGRDPRCFVNHISRMYQSISVVIVLVLFRFFFSILIFFYFRALVVLEKLKSHICVLPRWVCVNISCSSVWVCSVFPTTQFSSFFLYLMLCVVVCVCIFRKVSVHVLALSLSFYRKEEVK